MSTLSISNLAQFESQVKAIVQGHCESVLNEFSKETENTLSSAIVPFRGSSSNSIADEGSITYEVYKSTSEFIARPISGAIPIFLKNAEGNSTSSFLHREDAERWFSYHNIQSNSVRVRANTETGGKRPPLGSQERKFFENTFTHLNNTKSAIIGRTVFKN